MTDKKYSCKKKAAWAVVYPMRGLISVSLALLFCGCGGHPQSESAVFAWADRTGTVSVAVSRRDQTDAILRQVRETGGSIFASGDLENPRSEVYVLNSVGGAIRIPVSDPMMNLFRLVEKYSALTHGSYDMAAFPPDYMWDAYDGDSAEAPAAMKALPGAEILYGSDPIRIHRNSVELMAPGIRIDLSGILGSYALDLAVIELKKKQYGDLLLGYHNRWRSLGRPDGADAWSAPLADPYDATKELGAIDISNGSAIAVLTLSDDYVWRREGDKKMLVDRYIGKQAVGAQLVAVRGPSVTQAEALGRAIFSLGVVKARDLLGDFPECEFLVIPLGREEIYFSEGMKRYFNPGPDYSAWPLLPVDNMRL